MSTEMDAKLACPRCIARGKTWQGDDPRCAFASGAFADNWNCATLNALRDLAHSVPGCVHLQSDSRLAVITYDVYGEGDDTMPGSVGWQGFLILAWYKARGHTDRAFVMDEDNERPLTLKLAEAILAGGSSETPPRDQQVPA